MSKELFEKIESSLKSVEGQNATLLKHYEHLTSETKTAMEEITLLKNAGADLAAIVRSIQKLNKNLGHERRMAFGDPVKSLCADQEKAKLIYAGFAKSLGVLDKCSKTIRDIAAKDLDSGNTPGSTYIANAEIDREIYDLLLTYGAYRTLNVRTVTTRATELRIKTARAAFKFIDEAAAVSADTAKAGTKASLIMKKIGGLISVSNELLSDDVTGVVEDILRDFAEAFAYTLDWISFAANGDADDVDGGMTGMFFGGTARVAVSGNVSVATLDYEDYLACVINAPAAVLERSPKWWMHPSMIARSMSLKDTTGRPLFQSALEAPSFGSIGSLLGFPIQPVGVAPNVDGTSKKIAAFGDPQGQAVRIRSDLAVEQSEHFAFNTDEMTFRGLGRAASLTRAATAFQILTTAAS
jgi:HK97 family phage major capsid protein